MLILAHSLLFSQAGYRYRRNPVPIRERNGFPWGDQILFNLSLWLRRGTVRVAGSGLSD